MNLGPVGQGASEFNLQQYRHSYKKPCSDLEQCICNHGFVYMPFPRFTTNATRKAWMTLNQLSSSLHLLSMLPSSVQDRLERLCNPCSEPQTSRRITLTFKTELSVHGAILSLCRTKTLDSFPRTPVPTGQLLDLSSLGHGHLLRKCFILWLYFCELPRYLVYRPQRFHIRR